MAWSRFGVGAHIGRVLAAELETERREGAGRRALDGAPAGDGAGEVAMIDEAARRGCGSSGRGSACRFWNRPFGSPARSIAIWKRSPASSVCDACFSSTALPAMSAGTMVLMAVR